MSQQQPPSEQDENSELPGERIRDVIADVFNLPDEDKAAMQALVDSEIVDLPEHLYVKYLLPLTYRREDTGEYNIQEWRRIVGSLTADIRVQAPDGSALFISPGLFPEMMLFADRTGQSMRWTELVNNTIVENGIHPGLGEERLIEIGSRALPTLAQEEHIKHHERWTEVWKRYKVNGHEDAKVSATEASHHASSESEEEDEV